MLKNACASGLMACGAGSSTAGGADTNPPVCGQVVQGQGGRGVVITASHNPPEFNGIKCIHSDGTEMSRDQERESSRYTIQGTSQGGLVARRPDDSVYHCNRAVPWRNHVEVDVMAIRRAGLRVALDCAMALAPWRPRSSSKGSVCGT